MATRGLELPVAVAALLCLGLQTTHPVAPRPTPPPGMALIDVGTIDVGQHAWDLERECQAIGPKCLRQYLYVETPRVQTTVNRFFLDRDEVTNAQFVAMLNIYRYSITVFDDEEFHYPRYARLNVGAGDDTLLDISPRHGGIEYIDHKMFAVRSGRDNLPVVQVTWYGAQLYCAFKGKRLPTENEWEAAARGTTDRRFPWGSELPRCTDTAIPKDRWIPGVQSCERAATVHPIGSMAQDITPEGVRDLGGNVTEWTSTRFVEGDRGGRVSDGPKDAPRVIRGGSWHASLMTRTSGRDRVPPSIMNTNIGFRCASDISDAQP